MKTYSEFKQMWRKAKSEPSKRLEILLSSDEKIIFRDDCEPLDEIIEILSNSPSENFQKSKNVLGQIVKSKRFNVSRAFMCPTATKAALELLENLEILKSDQIFTAFN